VPPRRIGGCRAAGQAVERGREEMSQVELALPLVVHADVVQGLGAVVAGLIGGEVVREDLLPGFVHAFLDPSDLIEGTPNLLKPAAHADTVPVVAQGEFRVTGIVIGLGKVEHVPCVLRLVEQALLEHERVAAIGKREAIAYCCCQALGIPTPNTPSYLALYRIDRATLIANLEAIRAGVARIMGDLEHLLQGTTEAA
jgi:hypothetical protein